MIRHTRIARITLSLGIIVSIGLCGIQRAVADDPSPDELKSQFEKAYAEKDYAKALEASRKLHEMRPKEFANVYNIACMNCLLGNKNEAYKWLDKLCDTEFKDADYLSKDDDFQRIRDEARFRKIVARIRGKKPDEPGRKIRKLNDDKLKRPDKPLTAMEHAENIRALTAQLGKVSGKDKKKALEIAMSAFDHADKMRIMVTADSDATDRTRQLANALYGQTSYNVACMYALLDRKDEAFDYLDKAVAHPNFTRNLALLITGDADLEDLRSDSRYADIMNQLGVKVDVPKAAADKPDARFSDDNLPKVDRMTPEDHAARVRGIAGQLVNMMDKGYTDEKLELAREALAHAKVLMDLNDKNADIRATWSLANYNVACMYSLKDDADAAFFYLNRAVDAGGWRANQPFSYSMEHDSDLDNIRNDERYQKLLHRVRQLESGDEATPPADKASEPVVDSQWKVTLPKGYDASKPAPLVVALHHYNGNMKNTTDRWRKAASDVGAILLTPQGTVKEDGDGYSWGADINTIETDVMKAIDAVMDKHKVDTKKIVLGGYSQGGWATWAIAARNPDTFRGIIPVCGAVRPEIEKDLELPEAGHLRAWIMLGSEENSIVIDSNKRAAKLLKQAGAKVDLEVYEGVGHGFPKNSDEELTKALRFILG